MGSLVDLKLIDCIDLKKFHVCAVVVGYNKPKRTSGSAKDKFCASYTLLDSSLLEEDHDYMRPLALNVFGNEAKEFPQIHAVGDVILMRNVRKNRYNGTLQLLAHVTNWEYVLFRRDSSLLTGLPSSFGTKGWTFDSSSVTVSSSLTSAELTSVQRLFRWSRWTLFPFVSLSELFRRPLTLSNLTAANRNAMVDAGDIVGLVIGVYGGELCARAKETVFWDVAGLCHLVIWDGSTGSGVIRKKPTATQISSDGNGSSSSSSTNVIFESDTNIVDTGVRGHLSRQKSMSNFVLDSATFDVIWQAYEIALSYSSAAAPPLACVVDEQAALSELEKYKRNVETVENHLRDAAEGELCLYGSPVALRSANVECNHLVEDLKPGTWVRIRNVSLKPTDSFVSSIALNDQTRSVNSLPDASTRAVSTGSSSSSSSSPARALSVGHTSYCLTTGQINAGTEFHVLNPFLRDVMDVAASAPKDAQSAAAKALALAVMEGEVSASLAREVVARNSSSMGSNGSGGVCEDVTGLVRALSSGSNTSGGIAAISAAAAIAPNVLPPPRTSSTQRPMPQQPQKPARRMEVSSTGLPYTVLALCLAGPTPGKFCVAARIVDFQPKDFESFVVEDERDTIPACFFAAPSSGVSVPGTANTNTSPEAVALSGVKRRRENEDAAAGQNGEEGSHCNDRSDENGEEKQQEATRLLSTTSTTATAATSATAATGGKDKKLFMFSVKIEDATASADVVLFDKEAEKFLWNITCEEFCNEPSIRARVQQRLSDAIRDQKTIDFSLISYTPTLDPVSADQGQFDRNPATSDIGDADELYPLYLDELWHSDLFFSHPDYENIQPSWRLKERMKTAGVALVVCLNIGTDPPDVVKPFPCARKECWHDPIPTLKQKSLETIGNSLQQQYEKWQSKAKYKQCLDPTSEDLRRVCLNLRKVARSDRLLLHYNGHGVPRPTRNGEIWVFGKHYTHYMPVTVSDLRSWLGDPSVFVLDCSGAGMLIPHFVDSYVDSAEYLFSSKAAPDEVDKVIRSPSFQSVLDSSSTIVLAACRGSETLPTNALYPADIFTACLTTPIPIALRCFILQNPYSMGDVSPDLSEHVPGRDNDRKSPRGELNWIFTAITDTIAWSTLPSQIFQKMFRQDLLVASLFRNFLLAKRVMKDFGCTPQSWPLLPDSTTHPLWQSWDLAAECVLLHVVALQRGAPMVLPGNNMALRVPLSASATGAGSGPVVVSASSASGPSSASDFFTDQLTAFEIWLDFDTDESLCGNLDLGADIGLPRSRTQKVPLHLPILLQVLLSQTHRLRALLLLRRYLSSGPHAVNLSLIVGVFPYILKLLQSPASDIRHVLISIWACIIGFDRSCRAELIRDKAQSYFIQYLASTDVSISHRCMALFTLSEICCDNQEGRHSCLLHGLHRTCLSVVKTPEMEAFPEMRKWLCLCLSKLCESYPFARYLCVADSNAHEMLGPLLHDADPCVRAAVLLATGELFGATEHLKRTHGKSTQPTSAVGDGMLARAVSTGNMFNFSEAALAAQKSSQPQVQLQPNPQPQVLHPVPTMASSPNLLASQFRSRSSSPSGAGQPPPFMTTGVVNLNMSSTELADAMRKLIRAELQSAIWVLECCSDGCVLVRRHALLALAKFCMSRSHLPAILVVVTELLRLRIRKMSGAGLPLKGSSAAAAPRPHSSSNLNVGTQYNQKYKIGSSASDWDLLKYKQAFVTHTGTAPGVENGSAHIADGGPFVDVGGGYYDNVNAFDFAHPWSLTSFQLDIITSRVRSWLVQLGFSEGERDPTEHNVTVNGNRHSGNAASINQMHGAGFKSSPLFRSVKSSLLLPSASSPSLSGSSLQSALGPLSSLMKSAPARSGAGTGNEDRVNESVGEGAGLGRKSLPIPRPRASEVESGRSEETGVDLPGPGSPSPTLTSQAHAMASSYARLWFAVLEVWYKDPHHEVRRAAGALISKISSKLRLPDEFSAGAGEEDADPAILGGDDEFTELREFLAGERRDSRGDSLDMVSSPYSVGSMMSDYTPGGVFMHPPISPMGGVSPAMGTNMRKSLAGVGAAPPFAPRGGSLPPHFLNAAGINRTDSVDTLGESNHSYNPTQQQQQLGGPSQGTASDAAALHLSTAEEQREEKETSSALTSFLYEWCRKLFLTPDPGFDPAEDPLSAEGSARLFRDAQEADAARSRQELSEIYAEREEEGAGEALDSAFFNSDMQSRLAGHIDKQQNNVSVKSATPSVAVKFEQKALLTIDNANMTSLVMFHPFHDVVAVCDGSEIGIWSIKSCHRVLNISNLVSSFSHTGHDFLTAGSNSSRVTAMTWLNETHDALLLTGCDDGSIKVWRDRGGKVSDTLLPGDDSPFIRGTGSSSSGSFQRLRDQSITSSAADDTGAGSGHGEKDRDWFDWRDSVSESVLGVSLVSAFLGLPDVAETTRGSGVVVSFIQKSGSLVVGGNSSSIRIWDLSKEQCARVFATGLQTCTTSLASHTIGPSLSLSYPLSHAASLNPSSSDFASSSGGPMSWTYAGFADGTVAVFDERVPSQGGRVHSSKEHSSWIVSVSLRADIPEVITGSVRGIVKFSDMRTMRSFRTLEVQKAPLTAMVVHPAAPVMATGSHTQFIKLLTLRGDQLGNIIKYHDGFLGQRIGPVSCLAFHPNKMLLAAGATDNIVSIYGAAAAPSS